MTNALLKNGLFGNLFCDDEIAREFSSRAMLERMMAFEEAWTRALMATGSVTSEEGEEALAAFARFDLSTFQPASDRDGVPVPSLVAHLREGLGSGGSGAIHTGATSQDLIDTAMVQACIAIMSILESRLESLSNALDGVNGRFGEHEFSSRTRMQLAMSAKVSLRTGAWQRLISGQVARLPALRGEVARIQIGGAVGMRDKPDGAGQEVAEQVSKALGLQIAPVWHTDRSSLVIFGNWLTLVAGSAGKIAQDIALMAQQGIDEIELEGGGGSSAMPHKQNPVLAETIMALARHVAGQQGVLAQAMIHEQERSGAAWSLEWLTLPVMAEETGAALRHLEVLIQSVKRLGTAA